MKARYLKIPVKLLMMLIFAAFVKNAKANAFSRYPAAFIPNSKAFIQTDTTKRASKAKEKDLDNDARPGSHTVPDRDRKHPEDGIDNDIMKRNRQEFLRIKDPTMNGVPAERLLRARKIKDQMMARPAANIAGVNSAAPLSTTLSWTERGPNNVGGRTRALMFDLGDAAHGYKKVFAGGVDGGLWYTNDITASPVTWNKINDFFENIAISCIAQNPSNPKEIYAGTGEGFYNVDAVQGLGVWKSADGGATWARLASTAFYTGINAILVDKNGSVYLAALNYGILKSADGGTSWSSVIPEAIDGADLQLAANGDVYASTGVFSTGNIFYSDFAVNGANTGNAGTWNNITPSTSGAITPSSTDWWRIKLAAASNNPNIVYALFEGNNDYGLTSLQQYNKASNSWVVKTVPPGSPFNNGQAWYAIAAAVDPNNATTLYAGSLDGAKSTDGGASWSTNTQWFDGEQGLPATQTVHADHHAYVFAPGSSSTFLIGCDGGIFYSANANAASPAFADRNHGYNVTQFYGVALHPTDNNYALAGAQDNGTQQFTTAGMNATNAASGGDGAQSFIDQKNGNIQVTSYVYNNHWVSTDNGVTFNQQFFNDYGSFINPSDYDANTKNLYSGDVGGSYFRWNNVTTTSTSDVAVSAFNNQYITSVNMSPITANRVYFGLKNGTVVRVDNANTGTSATGIILSPNPGQTNISVSCVAVDPGNEDHLLVSYFNYGITSIFETKNATAATPTWTQVEGNLPDMPVRWVMFYPGDVTKALIATELGVWTTEQLNGASTSWAASNSGLANVEVDMLTFRASDRTLAAATHGRGLFTTTLPAIAPPVISYASPQSYNVGSAISALSPTSSNVSASAYSGTPLAIGSGFALPFGVAVDAAGNVYVGDLNNNAVKKIPAGGGAVVTLASGLNQPRGVAVDAAGKVYFADQGNNAIKKIPVGGGAPISIGSGFNAPGAVAVDAAGNVYVADTNNSAIKEIPVGGGAVITLGSGFLNPYGVSVDAFGNIYVADYNNNAIKKMPPGGGTPVILSSFAFDHPAGVAVDAAGNVFVGDTNPGAVREIPVDGSAVITIATGLAGPTNLAVDGSGNLYVANQFNNAIDKISPIGGFYINKALPMGLSFNGNTGIVSGTPASASPATNYTITAYNPSLSASATLNIQVTGSSNASLSNLSISGGTLSPVFSGATTGYTETVAHSVTSVELAPTAANATATIKVNGVVVPSGAVSPNIPLLVGNNTITILVAASDGVTTKTYTVVVTRMSNNANLAGLSISSGALAPAFSSPTATYNASVSGAVTSVTLTPTTSDANATVKVNGISTLSGTASAAIALKFGANSIYAVVLAQDGTKRTYTVTVTRLSNNANLANLSISSGTLTPAFASATTSYTASVSNATSSIKITPTTSDNGATLTVNGVTTPSGSASASIALKTGANSIYAVVLAQDGTRRTYTITVTRAVSNNANLANLVVSAGTLTPAFVSSTTGYTASVSNVTSSIKLTPTTSDVNATVQVNGVTVTSGSASASVPLGVGPNAVHAVVHAQDGTQRTYTVTVTRLANNANLANLTVSSGTLKPGFIFSTTTYADTVGNAISSVTLTPTTSSTVATVKVNGTSVTSGTASQALPLIVGNNSIHAVVLAQDGTQRTYTITVRRLTPGGLNNLFVQGNYKPVPLITTLGAKVEANNILSPNGDGINDIWVVKNIAFYPDNVVTVYDRSGRVVFTKKGYNNDWDGSYRGAVLNDGTYYYLIELGNGSTIKGFITVVKDK